KTRLRPIRSPSDPAVRSTAASIREYASTTHWRLDRLAFRSRWMSGSATFTIVMSSSNMNVAIETSSSVHHLRSITSSCLVVSHFPFDQVAKLSNRQVAELLADPVVEAGPPGGLR